ncbi:MAG: HAMP domain-containing histidine kinase [Planctomycetes bacterium]|nr:HAMP domain-containing histidine kinase [Planctomycetota bacterium]
MKRPWQVWLVFLVCVAGAGAAMAWLTQQALRADELRRAAEAETELEQRVSLAMWRMDTEFAPLVAEEVIRPPSAYRAAFVEPDLFDQQQEVQRPAQQAAPPTPAWRPSGLFASPSPYVVLHFEARPDGSWHSPQVPETVSSAASLEFGVSPDVIRERTSRLKELAGAVKLPQLVAELPDTPLPSVASTNTSIAANDAIRPDESFDAADDPFGEFDDSRQFFEGNTINESSKPGGLQELNDQYVANDGKPVGKSPKLSKTADFQQRGARYQSATKQSLMNLQQRQYTANAPADFLSPNQSGAEESTEEQVGVSRPVWIGDRLILARRVGGNGQTVVQGCWLDWPQLKTRLLAEAADLLPDADLVRADGDAADDPSRMLAGLPVRLVVGEVPATGAVSPTLGWALWMGWGAVALAVLAAAALLHGVMTLSERRAAFVSSVTHELRTPLTTFRMYAEMLARGMVPDAERRQEYFNTLQREAERLTLLVENVLAYARLERGRKPQAGDRITLRKLLEHIGPRLAQRAAQADMKCDLQLESHAADLEFTTDQSVVEQILFNLVDNAAKYAREAEDRQIHVEASRDGEWVRLVVRDHGPGIEQRAWGRQPRAFGKSAQQSAETAPGVGLGLALCRRLARQLGGRLEIDGATGDGATVALLLPT